MAKYTNKELIKLKKHLDDNIDSLIEKGNVSQYSRYPDDPKIRDTYQVMVLNVNGLGRVEMYFSMLSILKIDGIIVEEKIVNKLGFRDTCKMYEEAYKNKKIKDSKGWFKDK